MARCLKAVPVILVGENQVLEILAICWEVASKYSNIGFRIIHTPERPTTNAIPILKGPYRFFPLANDREIDNCSIEKPNKIHVSIRSPSASAHAFAAFFNK